MWSGVCLCACVSVELFKSHVAENPVMKCVNINSKKRRRYNVCRLLCVYMKMSVQGKFWKDSTVLSADFPRRGVKLGDRGHFPFYFIYF